MGCSMVVEENPKIEPHDHSKPVTPQERNVETLPDSASSSRVLSHSAVPHPARQPFHRPTGDPEDDPNPNLTPPQSRARQPENPALPPNREADIAALPLARQPENPALPLDREADIARLLPGDEVSVPVNGVTGRLMPETFKHTGIYIGNHQVISKYLKHKESDSMIEGPGVIAMELITKWKGWKFERRHQSEFARKSTAEKALNFFELYNRGSPERYHLKQDNCQHFSEKCLAAGIESKLNFKFSF